MDAPRPRVVTEVIRELSDIATTVAHVRGSKADIDAVVTQQFEGIVLRLRDRSSQNHHRTENSTA